MRMEILRGPDAGTLLVRALRGQAATAGAVVAVRSIASTPWASATFTGRRQRIALDAQSGDTARRWIDGLPEAEWDIRGHLVADVLIDSVCVETEVTTLSMSILTIEDN